MKKILVVLGTRPEAIKLSPVINNLKNDLFFDVITCSTGQHKEMLNQVLEIFDIEPDYNLELMSKSDSLTSLTSNILIHFDSVILKEKPDYIMVQGDTSTAMAASLAGFIRKIEIIHLEAGLRTNNKYSPFPEEVNRRIISTYSEINLAPTQLSYDNLIKENINSKKIFITGNTVIDSLFFICKKLDDNESFELKMKKSLSKFLDPKLLETKYILVTCHRRENHGDGLKNICKALMRISDANKDYNLIFPVHLNPEIRNYVNKYLGTKNNIYLCPPLDYVHFIILMRNCRFIISDSGGIQEEAPSLGKPVIVTRDFTERQEAIEAGTVVLVGSDENKIYNFSNKLITNDDEYERISKINNPYGNGDSSEKINDILKNYDC